MPSNRTIPRTMLSSSGLLPSFTGYNGVANTNTGGNSNETFYRVRERVACQLRNLMVYSDDNATTTTTTLTTRINGADGTITLSIPALTTGQFSDLTNRDAIAAGDYTDLRTVTGATAVIYLRFVICANYATGARQQYQGLIFTRAANTTFYYTLQGLSSATETTANMNVNTAGTWRNLRCRVTANTVSATSTFRTRKNVANGNQSVSIASNTTGDFEDTTNSDTVVSGDDICYQIVTGATGTSLTFIAFSTFQEVAGKSLAVETSAGAVNFALTRYTPISGHGDQVDTEAFIRTDFPVPFIASKLQCRAFTNTVNGASTFRSRKNEANGNQSISINATTTGWFEDAVNTDSIGIGDRYNYQRVLGGTSGSMIISTITSLLDVQEIKTFVGNPYSTTKTVDSLALSGLETFNGLA